jgi:hypothetical protein
MPHRVSVFYTETIVFRICTLLGLAAACAWGFQAAQPGGAFPSAADLERDIRQIALDPAECYRVRDLSFTRDDVRLYFNEGYLIFSKPVMGQRLSAVFTADAVEGGDGEVIVIPPSRSERQSLANFTNSPNLDEHLRAALMVFSDGGAVRLMDTIRQEGGGKKAPEMGAILAEQWGAVAANIAGAMRIRLIGDLLSARSAQVGLEFFALSGKTLGPFDILDDGRAARRIVVRQQHAGRDSFDVWTSFLPRSVAKDPASAKPGFDFEISRYQIGAEISNELGMKAVTRANVRVGPGATRAFAFDIARAMQITSVRIDGTPAELLRDESVRGRITPNGEEVEFLVVAPQPLAAGSDHEFEFEHQGNVIATRGEGVYFVNARGSWYPHVSGGFSQYDLTFRYPRRLTLVTAGDRVEERSEGDWRITRTRTSAIGAAGFNLGDYEKIAANAAGANIEVYGNRHLEEVLRPKAEYVPNPNGGQGPFRPRFPQRMPEPAATVPLAPDPLARLKAVAADMASSLEFFTGLFGAPVSKTLTVAPIPGTFGQGFPGLVYLSTFAYLDPMERPVALRNAREKVFFSDLMVPHEAAHQWWGGLVVPAGTEDEWLMEALANYSSLLWLEKKKGPKEVASVLGGYRDELLAKDSDGMPVEAAGPIVWGARLEAGNPAAWRAITYNKGTWILHMLRKRMGDAAFVRFLGEIRRRYEYKPISTTQFQALARQMRPAGLSADAIDSFFDTWVYSTGIPELKLKYASKGAAPSIRLSGTLEQTGVGDDFSADVPVEIQFAKGPPQTIWVRSSEDGRSFTAIVKQPPARVVISEDILKK